MSLARLYEKDQPGLFLRCTDALITDNTQIIFFEHTQDGSLSKLLERL